MPGLIGCEKWEEQRLLARYAETRDPALKEELARRFFPLVRSLAWRYRGTGEPLEDLIQVGSLGLVEALNRFDPEQGKRFVAYAAPTILGELRRHFRDRVWQVRVPRRLQERLLEIRGAVEELAGETGSTPAPSAIAEYLGLSEKEVAEAMRADRARRTLSLDAPRSTDDEAPATLGDMVGATEPSYDTVEAQLACAGAELTATERRVLHLRFHGGLNQYEIGRRIGVSQMQVSRIMRRALGKLLEEVRGGERIAA
jgi:RNA polymerase sigma-B factor